MHPLHMFSVAAFLALAVGPAVVAAAGADEPVRVIVDMDASSPGIQSHVNVAVGETVVEDVAVYLFDPLGERELWGIGYLGGLDRGIAFGHAPNAGNVGFVAALEPAAGAPANPGNSSELLSPAQDPGFTGPEVQYLEFGADAPAVIGSQPIVPLFTVDITLSSAEVGDVFDFHLLDYVVVWSHQQGGAFSTRLGVNSLDTGGDVVPDGTRTRYGVDPDVAIPAPPAAFPVDFIDGGEVPGPATITVVSAAAIPWAEGAVAASLRLVALHPNPFRGTTTVEFELAHPGPVALRVFDIGGRLVRVLLESPQLGTGTQSEPWDGRDGRGQDMPSGVYILRLEAGGQRESGRIVLAR